MSLTPSRQKIKITCFKCIYIRYIHKQTLMDMLEKVQRRTARFVASDYRRETSAIHLLHQLEWERLDIRRLKAHLIIIFKELNHLAPSNKDHLRQPADAPLNYTDNPEMITQITSKDTPSTRTVTVLQTCPLPIYCARMEPVTCWHERYYFLGLLQNQTWCHRPWEPVKESAF